MSTTVIEFENINFTLIFDLVYSQIKKGSLDYLQVMQDQHGFHPHLVQVAREDFLHYLPQCQSKLTRDYEPLNNGRFPKGYLLPATQQPELQEPFVETFTELFTDFENLSNSTMEEMEGYGEILIIDDVCNTGRTIVNEIRRVPADTPIIAICPLRIISKTPEQIAREEAQRVALDNVVQERMRFHADSR